MTYHRSNSSQRPPAEERTAKPSYVSRLETMTCNSMELAKERIVVSSRGDM
jgi:hypothetical protein